jgi:NTP pyrophosphatase (non-canonical NTP hydrolase)
MEERKGRDPIGMILLVKLMEECGEVIQEASKTFLNGPDNYDPGDPWKVRNRKKLEQEIGGLMAVVEALSQGSTKLSWENIIKAQDEKEKYFTTKGWIK